MRFVDLHLLSNFILFRGPKSKPCAWDEKNTIVRIKNHVLGIKKLFLRGLKSQALGKGKKKRMYNIIAHARLMEFSLGQ